MEFLNFSTTLAHGPLISGGCLGRCAAGTESQTEENTEQFICHRQMLILPLRFMGSRKIDSAYFLPSTSFTFASIRLPGPMCPLIWVLRSIWKIASSPSVCLTRSLAPLMCNTSPLMVWMPCCHSISHFTGSGCPSFLSAHGSVRVLSTACAALNNPRHSTKPHDMTPMVFGMDTI